MQITIGVNGRMIDIKEYLKQTKTVLLTQDAFDELNQRAFAQSEIIRCKDCKYYRKDYGWNCIEYTVCGLSPTHHPIRREEDFCSYAERQEE